MTVIANVSKEEMFQLLNSLFKKLDREQNNPKQTKEGNKITNQ